MFLDIQDLSLFMSVKAFLPSLRVLKINKQREETMMIESVISEKKVVLKLLINLLKLFQSLNLGSILI